MPEAELARVDECDRSIPRRETIRGTHWQKTPFGCLDLASRNPSWQRSCATATTDRTYDRKRSDSHEQTLATRGPSTYGSLLSQGRRRSAGTLLLRHQAPFRDHGFAHLTGGLGAGDLADFHRHFLAGESLELRGLGIAGGDELERFRPGFEVV